MSEYSEIDDINKKIKRYDEEINELQLEIRKLKELHWSYGKDEREFGDVSIECNYGSWQEIRDMVTDEKIFFMEDMRPTMSGDYIEFNLREAKSLVEYLNEKIEFFESKGDA